ncbi:MAG: hypothetical protein JWM11_4978, partial [Planctomycetaceae bacterium]|nr:hypothetical protein [Planctomycetaceae bacterium]
MNFTRPDGPQPELSQTGLDVDVGLRPGWGFKSIKGPIPGRWPGLSNRRPLGCKTGNSPYVLFRIAQTMQLQKEEPRLPEFRLFKHTLRADASHRTTATELCIQLDTNLIPRQLGTN